MSFYALLCFALLVGLVWGREEITGIIASLIERFSK